MTKDLYYDALNRAQHGWHEGTEDAVPFIKYLLGTTTKISERKYMIKYFARIFCPNGLGDECISIYAKEEFPDIKESNTKE